MLYGLYDEYGSQRRLILVILLATGAIGAFFYFRSPSSPFFSPQHAMAGQPAPGAQASGTLSGTFGALSGDSILGPPTISAAKIDAILATYNSPATGTGQTMYDLGLKYGIDPAFCLAFFIHESTAGTRGVARVTKSVGNIRVTPGYADYQGYRLYPTWEEGIEDWYKLIRELYVDGWQLTTLEQILPVYAPPADNNDTPAYIATVQRLVNSWRTENN